MVETQLTKKKRRTSATFEHELEPKQYNPSEYLILNWIFCLQQTRYLYAHTQAAISSKSAESDISSSCHATTSNDIDGLTQRIKVLELTVEQQHLVIEQKDLALNSMMSITDMGMFKTIIACYLYGQDAENQMSLFEKEHGDRFSDLWNAFNLGKAPTSYRHSDWCSRALKLFQLWHELLFPDQRNDTAISPLCEVCHSPECKQICASAPRSEIMKQLKASDHYQGLRLID
jgi:hypothetical protein